MTDDLFLYGGTQPWDSSLWVTTDDRVRGGSSKSHLFVINPELARFYGNLDTSTLGGAGFASQHSLGELDWDLSQYEGIAISVSKSDGKRYLLTLKDEIPGRRDDGRENSGISWEAEFKVGGHDANGDSLDRKDVFLKWSDFKATYRGRDKPDAKPLNLSSIKRVGLMMRRLVSLFSWYPDFVLQPGYTFAFENGVANVVVFACCSFFDEQKGDFSVDLHSIAARRAWSDQQAAKHEDHDMSDDEEDIKNRPPPSKPVSRLRALFCGWV